MGMYKYLADSYRAANLKGRLIKWRNGPSFERTERPARLNRARALGYKAKTGFIIVRSRVKRGGKPKRRPVKARKPSKMGVLKYSPKQSIASIAEQRLSRRYPNLEVLGTYIIAQDGQYRYFESILVDPSHPAIQSDKDVNWICNPQHRRRAFRGLTTAGRRARGLLNKAKKL